MNLKQTKRFVNLDRVAGLIISMKARKKKMLFKELVMEICIRLGVSDRTAKEYIKIALYKLHIKKSEL